MNKILVVDDDGVIRDVTTRILIADGYQVDQAGSLREARERITQAEYAVVLTDMKMPDGNGVTTIQTLKEMRPNTDVIVMTGYGTLDSVIESMRAGATDFLLKPCSTQQLRDTVKKTISKRELSQENKVLRALNDMKDKFLTLVSHELRTPLTLIYGYLSIIQRQGALNADQRDLFGIVMKSTKQLINIVNNVQTITQAEAGQIRLHLQSVQPRRLLAEVLAEMKTSASERDLKMTLEDGAEITPINADSIRLRQIFMELIQNAVRNTPDGGAVTVGVYAKERHVVMWVRDTGIGIPLGEQGKIFEPFYEVADVELHSSGTSEFKGGGIGLGLSLVKAVVEAHHGTIRLETAPNQGTLFEIFLPADLPPQSEPFPNRSHTFTQHS
jgi:signal transduction histidine kinase